MAPSRRVPPAWPPRAWCRSPTRWDCPACGSATGLHRRARPGGIRINLRFRIPGAMRTTIESYKQRAGRLSLEGIEFDDFKDRPLAPEALRSLRYMHDVEHHTVCYLRDLLLTPAHRDPDITSFLACWVFEEMWHGEAIGQVLEAHGEQAGAPRIADAAPEAPSQGGDLDVQHDRLGRLRRQCLHRPAHGAWPSPGPPNGSPSCTRNRSRSTCTDQGVQPPHQGRDPLPAGWRFRHPVD